MQFELAYHSNFSFSDTNNMTMRDLMTLRGILIEQKQMEQDAMNK
jgi:hypothetical protein